MSHETVTKCTVHDERMRRHAVRWILEGKLWWEVACRSKCHTVWEAHCASTDLNFDGVVLEGFESVKTCKVTWAI